MKRKVQDEKKGKNTSRRIEDILASISHEIGAPVNSICDISGMALHESDASVVRDQLFAIQYMSSHLMESIRNVLDFAQFQKNEMQVQEDEYDLTTLLSEVVQASMARKKEKKIELIMDFDADIPRGLIGDGKKIQKIMINLLDNAIKYTETGYVSVRVDERREAYGLNLSVTVKDTGIGIGEDDLERVFENFMQGETEENEEKGGIGLGLPVSKMMVETMGGNIMVQSAPGKGTTVRFVVPQKIWKEEPLAQVENRQEKQVAVYHNLEKLMQIKVRDEYSSNVLHMISELRVKGVVCRDLDELKRREESDHFTHIFLGINEYREDVAYFDELSEKTKVVLTLDRSADEILSNAKLLRLYKPYSVMTVVSLLNRESAHDLKDKHIYPTESELDDILVIGDLNVENGLYYCGGLERYLDVLMACYKDSAEVRRTLEDQFANEDWENYTIKVHSLKGTMLFIGAESLSEKAKALEMAGEKGDREYIVQNHSAMLTEYDEVMEAVAKCPLMESRLR